MTKENQDAIDTAKVVNTQYVKEVREYFETERADQMTAAAVTDEQIAEITGSAKTLLGAKRAFSRYLNGLNAEATVAA